MISLFWLKGLFSLEPIWDIRQVLPTRLYSNFTAHYELIVLAIGVCDTLLWGLLSLDVRYRHYALFCSCITALHKCLFKPNRRTHTKAPHLWRVSVVACRCLKVWGGMLYFLDFSGKEYGCHLLSECCWLAIVTLVWLCPLISSYPLWALFTNLRAYGVTQADDGAVLFSTSQPTPSIFTHKLPPGQVPSHLNATEYSWDEVPALHNIRREVFKVALTRSTKDTLLAFIGHAVKPCYVPSSRRRHRHALFWGCHLACRALLEHW